MSFLFTPGQLQRRADLFHQLGQLTAAGIPLPAALESQRQRATRASLRTALSTLVTSLQDGNSFNAALQRLPDWLPPFDAALLRAGEESGRLPETFASLAAQYRDRARLARTLLISLAYPLLVLHVALLIFPVQHLQQLVLQGNGAGYVGQKLALFFPLYALALAGIVTFQGSRGERWRAGLEQVLRLVPGLGSARRHLALSRLAAALEALISAGISIIEAWDLAATASGSPALVRAVRQARPGLYAGQTPSEMVQQSAEFPTEFATQYHTGEISGQLEPSLIRLREYHYEEGTRRLKLFFAGAVGAFIGGVMLFAAWQIIQFYLGYFQNLRQVL